MMELPATRHEALTVGSRYYQTGHACKNGHTGKRVTLSGQCYECLLQINRNARARERQFLHKHTNGNSRKLPDG